MERLTALVMMMLREDTGQATMISPPPPPPHRSIELSPVQTKHFTVRGPHSQFVGQLQSVAAATFYSALAQTDCGLCAGLRNGLILGGNAGRELTTVRWLVEFLTGYSENLLARSDSIHEKVCLT